MLEEKKVDIGYFITNKDKYPQQGNMLIIKKIIIGFLTQ